MRWRMAAQAGLGALALACVHCTAEARVIRFVVEERVPFASGTDWGSAGACERLRGTVTMEVDPDHPPLRWTPRVSSCGSGG